MSGSASSTSRAAQRDDAPTPLSSLAVEQEMVIDMQVSDDEVEAHSDDPFEMLHSLPPATAEGVYAGNACLLRECIAHQRYFVSVRNFPLSMQESQVEAMAGISLSCGCVTWRQLECIMKLLPADKKQRWQQNTGQHEDDAPKTFMTGAWARGPHGGLTRHLRDFPVTSCLLASIVRAIDPSFCFSSCTLSRNTCASPHKDSHNAPSSMNMVVPCSLYEGGGLWIQHEQGTTKLDQAGPPGFVMDTYSPLQFKPRDLHATIPWRGNRLTLIAFHVRNVNKMCARDLAVLKDAGFAANVNLA